MRIGVSLQDPTGPSPMTALREELQRAADQGFASAWMSNIFGVDALTALAVAGSGVPGIDVGTAVVPPTRGTRPCWHSRRGPSRRRWTAA